MEQEANKAKKSSFIVDLTTKYLLLLGLMAITAAVFFLIFFRPEKAVTVPNLVGKQLVDAALLLQEKDLYLRITQQYSNDPSDYGKVVAQRPKEGTAVRQKRQVILTVSKGSVIAEIPNLVGKQLREARNILTSSFGGFEELLQIHKIEKVFSTYPLGRIAGQDPKAGTKISNVGIGIDLLVSRGDKESDLIPDFTGLDFLEIFSYLEELQKPVQFYLTDSQTPVEGEELKFYLQSGVIIEQNPINRDKNSDNIEFKIGIRPFVYEQTKNLTHQADELRASYSVGIARIELSNNLGPITIYKSNGKDENIYLKIYSYRNEISFPYLMELGVSFRAADEKNNTIWMFTNTNKEKENS